jgi:excisionase family DNA binding protein
VASIPVLHGAIQRLGDRNGNGRTRSPATVYFCIMRSRTDRTDPSITAMTAPEFLNVREVARRLHCHPHTIRRWIWEGKLSAVKAGGLVRVPVEEIQKFVRPAHRMDSGGKGSRNLRRRGGGALLQVLRRLRKTIKRRDVEEMERLISQAELPADWKDPLG